MRETMPILMVAALAAAVAAAEPPAREVSVSGEGMVRARPDMAVADLGVTALGETVSAAMAESRRRMGAVQAALADAEVVEADVVTTDFTVYRETVRLPPRRGGAEEGEVQERFVVRNIVQVTVRDIDRAGPILDAAVDAGANEVRGIRFSLAEEGDLADRARALAAADARHRAQQLAQLHGARLGRVLRIAESGMHPVRADVMMMKAAEASGPTVSAGELTFEANLQVVYELID